MTAPSDETDATLLAVARAIWDAMVDDEPPTDADLRLYGYVDGAAAAIRAFKEATDA